jgi:hypothetical protein
MIVDDFNADGNPDIIFNTNDYSPDPTLGRFDALNGLVLKGDGAGGFTPLSMVQSGICMMGDGKGLARLQAGNGGYFIIGTKNKGPLQVFQNKKAGRIIRATAKDQYALITLNNGKKQKQELYYGSSFLSQGSRFFLIPKNALKYTIVDWHGKERSVE